MKPSSSEPIRLLDLRSQEDPANLSHLIRIATRAPLDPVPRLKGRIRGSLRRKSARRQRTLRAALLCVLVLLGGGVMAAVLQPVLHLWEAPKRQGAVDLSPSAARPRHRRGPPVSPAASEHPASPEEKSDPPSLPPALTPTPSPGLAQPPAEPTLAPLPRAESAAAKPRSRAPAALPSVAAPSARTERLSSSDVSSKQARRMALLDPPALQTEPRPSPAGPSASPPSSASPSPPLPSRTSPLPTAKAATEATAPAPPPGEQALLAKVVRSLRTEHQPGSALAVLDEYLARFPSGNLLPEATRLRTEALLALGHRPAALAELNREPGPGGMGLHESRLVRGELRAAAGRWQEALDDFDSVVRAFEPSRVSTSSTKLREHVERALWGRASARSHLGDEAGARADLRECLRRFPQGRFAGQAAHLLGEQR